MVLVSMLAYLAAALPLYGTGVLNWPLAGACAAFGLLVGFIYEEVQR